MAPTGAALPATDRRQVMSTRYIGIDPGASGGVAILFDHQALAWSLGKEATLAEIMTEAVEMARCCDDHICAVLEQVNAFPGEAVSRSLHCGMSGGMPRGG